MRCYMLLAVATACATLVASAPTPHHAAGPNEGTHQAGGLDATVEELEKLKLNSDQSLKLPPAAIEHVEFHSVDAVKANGELVSRVEQHATADAAPGEKPHVHAHAQYDVPAAGVHREVVQDGDKVEVHDSTAPTTTSGVDEKVYHGAARLAGPGVPAPVGHVARRAYTAEIKDTKLNNMDRSSGVQYSPLDMAEYVFWTGDEHGVTSAIEDFLQEGLMSKEEVITFLQEIKYNIEYLKAHYAQNARTEELAQQEKMRNLLIEQAKEAYQYRVPTLPSLSFGSAEYPRAPSRSWELGNNIPQVPALPFDYRQEAKRSFDPMLQTNIISTSDYDRDGGAGLVSEEEYEEMMDKLRAADTLYTQYTLEEIIYQLAKMMFSQSLSSSPGAARAGIQRFMTFLEMQAARGRLAPSVEKKVLDVMIAALTDTVSDHPELMQARELGGMTPGNRLMRQFIETSASEPGSARAVLAAYKDELLRSPINKLPFPERK